MSELKPIEVTVRGVKCVLPVYSTMAEALVLPKGVGIGRNTFDIQKEFLEKNFRPKQNYFKRIFLFIYQETITELKEIKSWLITKK